MGVWLLSCLCDDNLDGSVAVWLGQKWEEDNREWNEDFSQHKERSHHQRWVKPQCGDLSGVAENYHLAIKPNQQTVQNQFKHEPAFSRLRWHRGIIFSSFSITSSVQHPDVWLKRLRSQREQREQREQSSPLSDSDPSWGHSTYPHRRPHPHWNYFPLKGYFNKARGTQKNKG